MLREDTTISSDGLVYVSDRGNKRVQVFTPEGKFVAEQFVGLDSKYPLQARSTAFSQDQRFLYVGGTPVVYILNRKTLEVLGSFVTGSAQDHPPGHQIAADHRGNIYVVQAELTGADGSSGGTGAYKFALKGYSPVTKCCQGVGVHAIN
jgi:DNA-binding beta-propeller fold protein YncE